MNALSKNIRILEYMSMTLISAVSWLTSAESRLFYETVQHFQLLWLL